MNQELAFAKKIEEIRDLAKLQGNMVTKEQVEEAFSEIGMEASQLEPVYEYLKSKKIGVDAALNLEDTLSEDDKDYLSMYLEGLAELPKYSESEKKAYYIAAMAGEYDAKQRLIEIMLPDVVDLAKLYTGQGVMVEDLIGEGNVALSMAVEMLGALESPDEVPETLAKMVMSAMEECINVEEENKKYDNKMADKVNKMPEYSHHIGCCLAH